MIVSTLNSLLKNQPLGKRLNNFRIFARMKTSGRAGAILPEPPITRFGLLGILLTVTSGLLIGAAISKNMANFLEENDLFVPSDDDDDDD